MFKRFLTLLMLLSTGLLLHAGPVDELVKNSGNADDYKGSNLLILFDSTRVDVQETGLSHFHVHTLTKILTTRGATDQRVINIDYDPLSAALEIRMVKIYRKDGSVENLDPGKVLDYPAPARAIYWGARQQMIEIGRLEPGDAIELRYFKKGFTYALLAAGDDDERFIPPMRGHYYDIVPFWSSHPTLEKVYITRLPADKPLQYEFYNGECKTSLRFVDGKHEYTFSKKDIMPVKTEPNMVDLFDVAPKLLLSTSPDWEAKSRWFYGVNEDYGSFASTPEAQQFVNELLKEAKTEMDSVSILTHWVADNMRYSGISMGKGEGYTLHNTEMNFRDRCGVCKDKAALLISFLRMAGFDAYAAMTMAGSRIEDIPADHFNHCVTVVKLSDGGYHLLDPTWVPFVRELWSSAEQQQNYLMGLPEGADLKITPVSPPENHYLKIKANTEIKADGTLTGSLELEAEGQTDAAVRGIFTRSYMSEWDKSLEAELLRIHPAAKIISAEYGNPINYMEGPINIKINFIIPGYSFTGSNEMIFTPLLATHFMSRAMGHLYMNTTIEERKFGFRDRCSRLVELEETITIPSGFKPVLPDVNTTLEGISASYTGGYSLKGNTIELKQKVVLEKRIYESSDWQEVRPVVKAQQDMAELPIVLKK
ncbi:MAG TPA: DUF3857 and transglutaminase domain-containing protein [Bacteroidales bacterium]|nr:DUF3857 and transglutaminase domain-containing protein [Bacteroidales bacterium]